MEKWQLEDELEEAGSGVDGNGFVVITHILYLHYVIDRIEILPGHSVDIVMKYTHRHRMSSLQSSWWKSLGLRAATTEVCIVHVFVLGHSTTQPLRLCHYAFASITSQKPRRTEADFRDR